LDNRYGLSDKLKGSRFWRNRTGGAAMCSLNFLKNKVVVRVFSSLFDCSGGDEVAGDFMF